MSSINPRGSLTTEIALVKYFKVNNITGWIRHYKIIIGKSDFIFPKHKIAIFVDGYFWYGCKKHGVSPVKNSDFRNKKYQQIRLWIDI
jgi:DNA mismatch endonuclease (patch repair protein)